MTSKEAGLDEKVKELATGRNFAVLSTIMPDGRPQTHVMWVHADGDHLEINTEIHRQKFRNITRDPRVSLAIWDIENPYRYAEVRGRVVDTIRGQQARDHIDMLSYKYGGQPYDDKMITTERVIVRISPEHVTGMG